MTTQAHILSFEGPDAYARAGGIATRICGLSSALAQQNMETHLWFVGDPTSPGHELAGGVHLHRWSQWLSAIHPAGVYDGEVAKVEDYATSAPPWMFANVLGPHLRSGGRAVVLAEEWHTVHAVLHLDWILRREGLRDRVAILWNANNTFGFDHIPWEQLAAAAVITTVSRYMRHLMRDSGTSALVIPNGLGAEAFVTPDVGVVSALQARLKERIVLSKVARWDPDKAWMATIDIVALLRDRGMRPLLVARGGIEAYGQDVLAAARRQNLRILDRKAAPGAPALVDALADLENVDIVNITSSLDAPSRTALFQASSAVLANSAHEPFGLVGLEAMAAGGIACTGTTGEDYAIAGRNAIVLQTPDPREFMNQFARLQREPFAARDVRAEGQATAKLYDWPDIVRRNLLPQVEVAFGRQART
jgi:glycosyltransferase involved in cell wall biosynthesis